MVTYAPARPGLDQNPGPRACDVVLDSSSVVIPARCASCMAPHETALYTSKRRGSARRSFAIPYCGPCARRALASRYRARWLARASAAVAMLGAAGGFLVPGLPLAALIAGPTLLAAGFGVVAMTVLRPCHPAPPATAAGAAVRLVRFRGYDSVLSCDNPEWARALAAANRSVVVPRRRRVWFASRALTLGALVAPAASAVTYAVAHPGVHVDNAGATAIQIWVDGVAVRVEPPNSAGRRRRPIRLPYGKHTFGYSAVGAPRPEATLEADVRMMRDQLYNPGRTACYQLIVDSYGNASTRGYTRGPLPVEELYTLDGIDTWFADNPSEAQVDGCERGVVKTAIQRMASCRADAR